MQGDLLEKARLLQAERGDAGPNMRQAVRREMEHPGVYDVEIAYNWHGLVPFETLPPHEPDMSYVQQGLGQHGDES